MNEQYEVMSGLRLDGPQLGALSSVELLAMSGKRVIQDAFSGRSPLNPLGIDTDQRCAFVAESLGKVAQQLLDPVAMWCLLHDVPRCGQRRIEPLGMVD
jgi:hypothetical protein